MQLTMAMTRVITCTSGMQLDQMGLHLLHLYASVMPVHEHPPVHALRVD